MNNTESAMINAALELLTSTPLNQSKPTESKNDSKKVTSSLVPEVPLDWRLEVSQTERYQVIQRLCHELIQSLPPDQKNDSRIIQIAQQIEKRFFDSSKSKIEYFTHLKSQILDIQRKSTTKNNNQQSQSSASSSTAGSPGALSTTVMSADGAASPTGQSNLDNKNIMGSSQPKQFPALLTLSEQDKKVVKEKLRQISHLFPKISGLVNTISTLGTKSDILQIHKLVNIKKSIYYQLEGMKVDRYTISPEAASSLQSTLVRYFQYGGMLIKQNQERNAQLQLIMDKNDPKSNAHLFQAPSPQMQSNSASPPTASLSANAVSPFQPMMGNITPSPVGLTPIMPRTIQQDSSNHNAMKLNAQMKQQLYIQKINQKQAQARQNVITHQDIDYLLSDNSPIASSQKNDSLHIITKEDDLSIYFNFDGYHAGEESPTVTTATELPLTRKRKADSLEETKRIKSADQDTDMLNESPASPPIPLFQELANLEKEFDLAFETTDLDHLDAGLSSSIKTMVANANQSPSPRVKRGKTLVFCSIPNSPLRIAFRLSKTDYEEAAFDRQSRTSIIHAAYFEKFRHYGCGLEDVEVVSDQNLDYYDDITKIHSFARDLGVGISGNMVQISDILRYTFDNVLNNKN